MKKITNLLLFLLCANVVVGQFGTPELLTGEVSPRNIVEADLDNDGYIDVIAVSNNNHVVWYKNLGGVSFGEQNIITILTQGTVSLYSEDVDMDGDMDVLSASSADSKVAWYENLGNGIFGSQQVISFSMNFPRSIYMADFDNDGDEDLVVGSSSASKISWFENFGNGSFGTEQLISSTAGNIEILHTADLDGDGYKDIMFATRIYVSGTFPSTIKWHKNLGNGSFGPEQIITTLLNYVHDIHAEDITNDGFKDVISTSLYDNKVAWYENLGNGTFGSQQLINTVDKPRSVDAKDIDNDGDIDLLISSGGTPNYLASKISWYENLGGGVFIDHQVNTEFTFIPQEALFNDINNDGFLDVSTIANGSEISYYLNTGSMTFSPKTRITSAVNDPRSLYAADIDNDGKVDLLSASYDDGKVAWYKNLGNGKFGVQQLIDHYVTDARAILGSDFDLDGNTDVVACSYFDDVIYFYKNLGGGTFSSRQIITNSVDGPVSVFSGDLNNDGKEDIISASYNDDKIAWYENLGGGLFGSQQIITVLADGVSSVYAEDLDGDNDLEILFTSKLSGEVGWFENLGGGSFGAKNLISTTAINAWKVIAKDLDNDSLIDILYISETGDEVSWSKNLGGGSFSSRQIISLMLNQGKSVDALDIDGDGDLDIISSGHQRLQWSENLGGGIFNTEKVISTDYFGAYSLISADIDMDGDADIIGTSDPYIYSIENFFGSLFKLSGEVYFDKNQNKIRDSNEVELLSLIPIQHNNSGSFFTFDGSYKITTDSGEQVVSIIPPNYWKLTTDSLSYTKTLTSLNPTADSLDFGFFPDTLMTKISSDLTGGFPRCNTLTNYWININNQGTIRPNGVINLNLDNDINFISSSIPPDSIIGQNIYWHFDSLSLFSNEMITAVVQMPSFVSMGSILSSYLIVNAIDSLGGVVDSSFRILNQTLVCAYDPNDKMVTPQGLGVHGYILNNQKLEYLIRFQNTGNDTAITVMIRDQLDADLDWGSIQPIASSHPMQMWVEQDGEAIFKFENIMLPDSNVNFLGSQGFVKFSIDMKSNLIPETQMFNEGHIYFDSNPAVITNTVLNTIYDCNKTPIKLLTSTTCKGEQIKAYSPEGGFNNYTWEIDTFYTSTTITDTLIWVSDTVGTFNLKMTISNELCSKDTTVSITVSPAIPLINNNTIICQGDSLLIYGNYQNIAGTYYDTLQAVIGCDSVISTTLTVNSSYLFTQNQSVCQGDSVLIYGNYQSIAGTYYDSLQTINGCDSVLSTTLTIDSSYLFNQNQSICQGDSILIYGNYENTAGIYYDSLQTINGCDSMLSITLSVNPVYLSNTYDTICQGDSIFLYGQYQNVAGTYYDSLQTINGCDSVLSTMLKVNYTYSFTQNQSICQGDSVLVYGSYQSIAGTYYDSLQTINGCDSVLSTTLTIDSSYLFNQNQFICQGDSMLIYGNYQSIAGTYYDSLQTINGCDSVLSITLLVNPFYLSNTNDTICQGDSVLIYGNYENTAGVYYDSLQSILGCDSVLATTLFLNANFNSNQNQEICQGDSVLIYGNYENTSGVYYDSLQTINGCDSVLSTTLIVNPLPNVTLTNFNPDTICSTSNAVTLPNGSPSGGIYSGTGVSGGTFDPNTAGLGTHSVIYTYTDINSCINSDSTFITVEQCVGMDDLANDLGILIYPNPNTGLFTIEKSSELNKEVRVSLLDATSRVIIDKLIPKGQQKIEMDITSYSKGIYYLQLTVGKEVFVKKILKN